MDKDKVSKNLKNLKTPELQTGDLSNLPAVVYPPPFGYGYPIPVGPPGIPSQYCFVPPWTYFPTYVYPPPVPPGSTVVIPTEDGSQYRLVKAPSFYNPIFNAILEKSQSDANSLPDKSDSTNRYDVPQNPDKEPRTRNTRTSEVPKVPSQRLKQLSGQVKQFQLNPELLAKAVTKEANQNLLKQCLKAMKQAFSVPREITEMTLVMLIQRLLKLHRGIDSDSDADSGDEDNLDEYILHGWLDKDYVAKFLTEVDKAKQKKTSCISTTRVQSAVSSACDYLARKSGLETEFKKEAVTARSSRSPFQGADKKYSELFKESTSNTSKNGDGGGDDDSDSFSRKHKKYMALLRLAGIQPLPPNLMTPLNLHKSNGKLSESVSARKYRSPEDILTTKPFSSDPGPIEGSSAFAQNMVGSQSKSKGAKFEHGVTNNDSGVEFILHPKKVGGQTKNP